MNIRRDKKIVKNIKNNIIIYLYNSFYIIYSQYIKYIARFKKISLGKEENMNIREANIKDIEIIVDYNYNLYEYEK